MIKYTKLYKQDSAGNIRVWYMEQDAGKYRTVAGLSSGSLVTSKWTIAEPKNIGQANMTNAAQQATAEILAKYKKQEKLAYHRNVADVTKSRFVQPMLAKKYSDYSGKLESFEEGNWLLQCKFNGMRCIATKAGLFTRKGERYMTCPHIEARLVAFFTKYPDAVLDGELFNMDLRQQLNELSKLIRRTVNITEDDLKKSRELVKFFVYDGYGFTKKLGPTSAYYARKAWIDSHVTNGAGIQMIMPVQDIALKSQNDLEEHFSALIQDGHEGVILRYKHMPYEHKRSKNLLKVKLEDDAEAAIVDIVEGKGNWSGTGKKIVLNWKGRQFEAAFKGTREQAAQFLKDRKRWIGQTVTFLYNGLTGLGTPSFARVDINNCIPEPK